MTPDQTNRWKNRFKELVAKEVLGTIGDTERVKLDRIQALLVDEPSQEQKQQMIRQQYEEVRAAKRIAAWYRKEIRSGRYPDDTYRYVKWRPQFS